MFLHALAGAIAAAHPSIPISQELRGLIQGYSRATGKAQGLLFPEGSYQTPANVQDASAGFSRARVTPADRPSRFQGGRFVRMPYQRSPDREKSIERRKRLAATQPLRPAMAARAKLTISELAYARLIADDNLMAGDSRDCHDKMAARGGTCSRTIQRAQKRFEDLKWIEVERRPIEGRKHDANIVRIISPEWLMWIMMGPSPIARQKRLATENQLFSRAIEMLERRPNAVDKAIWIDPDLKAKLDRLETGVKKEKIGAALIAPRNVLLE